MRFLLEHLTLILATAAGIWIAYASWCAVRARLKRPPPFDTGEDESRAAAVREQIRRTMRERRENPLPVRPPPTPGAQQKPAWWRRVWPRHPRDPMDGPFGWMRRKVQGWLRRDSRKED